MGKILKIFLIFVLFLSLFEIVFAKTKIEKENGLKQKLLEFIASLIDLLIRFVQLIQDFFGLIVKFLNWIKESILKI